MCVYVSQCVCKGDGVDPSVSVNVCLGEVPMCAPVSCVCHGELVHLAGCV